MRLLLGELAPVVGDVAANVAAVERAVRAAPAELAVFPELFLSGYRVGDRVHHLALTPGDSTYVELTRIAAAHACALAIGAPIVPARRPGEVENAVLLIDPTGRPTSQTKRYLPNFGPFEEAVPYTPTDRSSAFDFGGHRLGLEICYDAFFPEVSRELALDGAELLVIVSASPVTSRRMFERLLPARAIENGVPVVYVNRVGVEDGFVFGGGSGAWDPKGEPLPLERVDAPGLDREERLYRVDVDLTSVRRWRPFRPVLRDVRARPGAASSAAGSARTSGL